MEYWWEGSASNAIPPTSTSDIAGQYSKIGGITFGAALLFWFLQFPLCNYNFKTCPRFTSAIKFIEKPYFLRGCLIRGSILQWGRILQLSSSERALVFKELLGFTQRNSLCRSECILPIGKIIKIKNPTSYQTLRWHYFREKSVTT